MLDNQSVRKRYHEVDALRVIAMGLLTFYHILVSYQPFAPWLLFIQNKQLLENMWFVGELLNIWRIPVLFLISGMGVRFAMERRTTRQLLEDRATRILIPLFFGSFFIVPIFAALFSYHNQDSPFYFPNPGHLWFLQYLMLYFLCSLPAFVYIRKHPDCLFLRICRGLLNPVGLIVLLPLPLMLEVWIIDPDNFSAFALTDYHRFWYGLVCFLTGFLAASVMQDFSNASRKACHGALIIALSLYLVRIGMIEGNLAKLLASNITTAFESMNWMLAVIGYGSLFLNKPSRKFAYLNRAVFPVYILHLPTQQLIAVFLFPVELAPEVKLFFHTLVNLAVCLAVYELVIRRISWLHPLLGLGIPSVHSRPSSQVNTVSPSTAGRGLQRLALYGLTPFLIIYYGLVNIIEEIEKANAFFKKRDYVKIDYRDVTANPDWDARLKRAAEKGDVETMNLALTEGANVNGQNAAGHSALGSAVWYGQLKAVQVLIHNGADVNLGDNEGYRPLHRAMVLGRYEEARLLLEKGASLKVKDKENDTPLDSMSAPFFMVYRLAQITGIHLKENEVLAGRQRIKKYLASRRLSDQKTKP